MKDCKVVYLPGETLSKTLYVVFCPDTTTGVTWKNGKTTEHSMIKYE